MTTRLLTDTEIDEVFGGSTCTGPYTCISTSVCAPPPDGTCTVVTTCHALSGGKCTS